MIFRFTAVVSGNVSSFSVLINAGKSSVLCSNLWVIPCQFFLNLKGSELPARIPWIIWRCAVTIQGMHTAFQKKISIADNAAANIVPTVQRQHIVCLQKCLHTVCHVLLADNDLAIRQLSWDIRKIVIVIQPEAVAVISYWIYNKFFSSAFVIIESIERRGIILWAVVL